VPAALGHGAVSPGTLTVYIAGDGQYVLPDAKIRFAQRTSFGSIGYLTRNEITLDQNKPPSQDPIAYRGNDVPFQEVIEMTKEVRVPVEVHCDDGCCSNCNARPRTRVDLGLIVIAVAFVLRRKRRRH
jgi:hypothetical protein